MEVLTFPLGPLETNSYLLINDKKALAIDVGGDPSQVISALQERGVVLEAILLTHLHFDHTFGVKALHEATKAPVFASDADSWMRDDAYGKGGLWGLPQVPEYTFTSLAEGNTLFIGLNCFVIATPGHTPGGLSFYFPEAKTVFAGDTLFFHSIGRTDFPRGDTSMLTTSITKSLFTLPDETIVFSGHGSSTTIGEEKEHNPYV